MPYMPDVLNFVKNQDKDILNFHCTGSHCTVTLKIFSYQNNFCAVCVYSNIEHNFGEYTHFLHNRPH